MEVKIVLGHTFGDEGKGVTVQWLCKKAVEEGKKPLVVRFSGGPQAAHTIFNNGTEHICSSFGSGVLLGVPTLLNSEVFIDPISMKKEYDILVSKGIKPKISAGFNRVITPYDVIAGINNTKVREDGTCGKGIYMTFERYEKQYIDRFLYIDHDPDILLARAAEYYGVVRNKEYDDIFRESYQWMSANTSAKEEPFDVIIFEGSQGLLLDMDNGFYPNVTPSKVGLNGIPYQILKGAELYLVTRTYTTRHGNGYTPKAECPYDLSDKHETNVNNEFQGEFRTGLLEVDLLNRAYERHCIDNYINKYNISLNLVITHMDVIKYVFEVAEGSGSAGDIKPDDVYKVIQNHLCYTPDHVYYNDSVESDIKEII